MPVAWSTVQLAEFLEVFEAPERGLTERLAIDRIADSLDAEVVMLVLEGVVSRGLGMAPDHIPPDLLAPVSGRRSGVVELAGVGTMHALGAPVGGHEGHLLVLRCGAEFDREEETLLRSMGRALGLALTASASLASSQRLADQVGERQELSNRMFRIQQSISHRAPLQEVLDAIAQGAAEVLGVEVVGLRVAGPDAEEPPRAALVGYSDVLVEEYARLPMDAGFAGRAYSTNSLVVTDDYAAEPTRVGRNQLYGLQIAMAAPVHRNGEPVGVLNVASGDAGRRFTLFEQEILLSLAEHASLAVNDASAVHQLQRSLDGATHRAGHDALTGLPNRSAVLETLDAALTVASEHWPVSLLFVDLDRFKPLNDVFGHAFGDAVLREVADRLRSVIRVDDTLARLAGDEFVVVVPGVDGAGAAELGRRLTEYLEVPLEVQGRVVELSASVGVAESRATCPGEQLVSDADVAMYRAKDAGRSGVVRFDRTMRSDLQRRSDLERELATALRHGQIQAHFQPVVDTGTRSIVAVEALARWEHPERGLLLPDSFINIAEETGQIVQLDRMMLFDSCRRAATWTGMHSNVTVSVNLSARHFSDRTIVAVVREALAASGLEPGRLWLEITERVAMDDDSSILEVLSELRATGVRFMIDDFGTGYSSLSYLKRYPVDAIKIDRCFVTGLGVDPLDDAIVAAIVQLADALGHRVIAEGVETEEQVAALAALGCTDVQGFLFSRAVDGATLHQLLDRGALSLLSM